MKKNYTFFLVMFFMSMHVHAQTVIARLDINQGLDNGTITATATAFDTGEIKSVFDNNAATLVRTHSINPLLITLQFSAPVTLVASKIILGTDGNWTVETATTLSDLNSATGTYKKIINQKPLTGNIKDSTSFSSVSANFVRLTARRTVGDDFVHLNEWQLYAQQTLNGIAIKQTPFFIFKSATSIEVNPLQKVNLKIQGSTTFGVNVDLSGAIWSSSNSAIASVNSAGVLTANAIGTATITANYSGIITNLTTKVVADRNGSDLSVQYIKRSPEIPYVENSSNPSRDGWPAVNSTVKWRAYVKNWFPVARNNVSYKWLLNGVQIGAIGSLNIPARGIAYAEIQRPWTFTRETLTFVIDANKTISEVVETNNQVTIYTDAISLNLTIEQSLYEYFHRYQRSIGGLDTNIKKTNSYEDWAQIRHLKRWNEVMLPGAKYNETPLGVLDRIRIDSIIIVPDNALPLAAGIPSNNPNSNDKTVDLQWGYPTTLIKDSFTRHINPNDDNFYIDTLNASDQNPFFFEGSLLHELGHARYLIDEYGFDVHDSNGGVIAIKENGVYISQAGYLTVIGDDLVYSGQQRGLMNSEYTYIDRHSAAALNLIAGRRAVAGNMNPPGNIGVFLNDLPAQNRFTLKDAQGKILANAKVKIYQTVSTALKDKIFDSIPELILTSDAAGQILVGKNPFQTDNYIKGPSEGVLLVRVETATHIGYAFFEVSWFNLAFWRNETLGDFVLEFPKLIPIKATANVINGPSCVLSGQTNTFTINPEFSNYNYISWWVNGDATIKQDPADPKKATITASAFNQPSITVNVGINYPTAPWYQTYQKQVLVNNCTPSMRMNSSNIIANTSTELLKIKIVDLNGREVLTGETYDAKSFIDNQSLPSGIYLMQVTDNTGSYVIKIAK